MRSLYVIAPLVALVALGSGTDARAQTPSASTSASTTATDVVPLPDLAARVTPSVLLLHVFDDADREIGTGTGFFVSSDGLVITNHHVAEHATRMTATTSEGRDLAIAGLLAVDEENDLALLQAEGGGRPALPLVGVGSTRIGEDVVVVGSPRGLSASVSTGIVSAIREHGLKREAEDEPMTASWSVQITAAVSPGSSGSPVLNRRGDVIAVVVGQYTDGTGLSFAIRAELARKLVDGVTPGARPKPFKEPTTARDIARNLGISFGAFAIVAAAWIGIPRYLKCREERASRRPIAFRRR